jgi:hypothetical protein
MKRANCASAALLMMVAALQQLDWAYVARAEMDVALRLSRGGVRLAAALNKAFVRARAFGSGRRSAWWTSTRTGPPCAKRPGQAAVRHPACVHQGGRQGQSDWAPFVLIK